VLRLGLLHAKPGMVLGLPVLHPTCPEVVLLRAGAALEETTIARLREIGVREAWIRYPSLDHLIQFVNPAMHEACRAVTADIGKAIDSVLANSHARLDFYAYKRAVMGVIENAISHPKAAIFIHEMTREAKPALRHAGNVCVLSILMGLKLDFYLVHQRSRLAASLAMDLSGLGVGAMLHDVGMLRLAPDIVARHEATGDESDPEFQEHTRIGFELVKGELDPTAASAVLHHHQKYDGTGFPRRAPLRGAPVPLRGSDIHVFARILACADLLDRIRFNRVLPNNGDLGPAPVLKTPVAADPASGQGVAVPTEPNAQPNANAPAPGSKTEPAHPPMPMVRAIKLMLGKPYRDWVDPVVMRALLSVAPAFAPGSIVRLSDGRRAAVADWRPANPCAPTVEILGEIDRGWDSRATERIDLEKPNAPRIATLETTEGDVDVSNDLFYPSFPGDFDLIRIARVLENRATEVTTATQPPKPKSTPAPPVVRPAPVLPVAKPIGPAQPKPAPKANPGSAAA
jgi:HD-GYP domain-containing protein (c-di-GMP phosphodiesterase class II)